MTANKKLGIGMYTVHKAVRKDMLGTFRLLADMGYDGIEFYGETCDFEIERTREALDRSGLRLTSWHIEWRNLQEETVDGTIEYLKRIGCKIAVVPCLGGKWNVAHDASQECEEVWLKYIRSMNGLVEKLEQNGIHMGYHNHEHEFMLKYDGRSVFDLLWQKLDPRIIMELDTGNCIEGGENPKKVLDAYLERKVLLHLKPYSCRKGFDVVLGDSDDENRWGELLPDPKGRVLEYLIESECTSLPELVNAQLCMEGFQKCCGVR